MGTRIYLCLNPETLCAWHRVRDTKERARSEVEIRACFEQDVPPSIEKWVDPQRKFATRGLDANATQFELVKETLRKIWRIPVDVRLRIVPICPN